MQYLVGVMVYFMLSGEFPFESKSKKEIVNQIRSGRVPFSDKAWRGISPEAIALVRKMLVRLAAVILYSRLSQ